MLPTRRACEVLLALAASALAASGTTVWAQAIASVTPLALRPGQTQEFVLAGSGLAEARQLWSGFPQKSVITPESPKHAKNPAAASLRVTVPPQAPLGIYGIRVATLSGISPLRLVMLDDLPTVRAAGANLSRAAAQNLSLPTAVEGTLPAQQLHYFKFHAEPGQRLSFEVYARRIGSLLDPTLRLFDAAGREVTYSDDVPGLSEDAAIQRTFRTGGDYVLELGDNLYQGGGDYFYRLRIGDFPAAPLPYPLAATRGGEFTCQFADNARSSIEPARGKAPSDPSQATLFVHVHQSDGNSQSFAAILLSDHKQATESEPNNSPKTASRVNLGDDLNGRLDLPDDVDHFVFHTPANEYVRFTSFSRRLGSPADLVLRLHKPDGSVLASAESQGAQEATLGATLPAAGDYVLEVRDLSRRGGPRFVYHVESIAEPAKPPKDHDRIVRGFSLSASADSVVIPAGGTAAISVTAVRSSYGGPISVRAVDLPSGVTARPVWIGRGEDSAELTLQETRKLTPGLVHAIRIVGSPEHSDSTVAAQTTDAVRTQLGGMPYPPLDLCRDLALVAGPRPNFTLHTEPNELVLSRDRPATFKLIAERQKGFEDEIAVTVSPAKKGLPPGVAVRVKPIAKGANSTEITFTADGKAAANIATVVLVGTLKKGNQAFTEPAPAIGLTIEQPSPRRKSEGKKS
ncbi:MAG TPA: hypothetical protein VG055_28765 [Planctomycetaceae bacterium]|jgi:hypothetical protein|nr:hypothetical protein [Planctomycetaceae bacterium]